METNIEKLERIKVQPTLFTPHDVRVADLNWLIEQAERTNDLNIKYENGLLQYHLVKDSNIILAKRVEELEMQKEIFLKSLQEIHLKTKIIKYEYNHAETHRLAITIEGIAEKALKNE